LSYLFEAVIINIVYRKFSEIVDFSLTLLSYITEANP